MDRWSIISKCLLLYSTVYFRNIQCVLCIIVLQNAFPFSIDKLWSRHDVPTFKLVEEGTTLVGRPKKTVCLPTSVCWELVDPWDVQTMSNGRWFDGVETSNVRNTALKSVKKCTKLIVNYYFTLPAFGWHVHSNTNPSPILWEHSPHVVSQTLFITV